MWQRKKREDIQVNLTPLIDVVFLLLIFFMVSTSFKKETKLTLELPEASGQPMEQQKDIIEISVNKNGDVFVNGQGLLNRQEETIQNALRKVPNAESLPIVINADKAAPYQAVISVMDAAGKAGFNNLTLATQEPKNSQ